MAKKVVIFEDELRGELNFHKFLESLGLHARVGMAVFCPKYYAPDLHTMKDFPIWNKGILVNKHNLPYGRAWSISGRHAEEIKRRLKEMRPEQRSVIMNLSKQLRGDKAMIHIVEMFPSVEGEGPRAGIPTFFIRTAGCNFRCPWCDTKQSWEPTKRPVDTDSVIEQAKQFLDKNPAIRRLSITGGNPLLHKDQIKMIFLALGNTAQIHEINLEHPGVLPSAGSKSFSDEKAFLKEFLNDFETDTRFQVSSLVNMDVKLPLWDMDKKKIFTLAERHRDLAREITHYNHAKSEVAIKVMIAHADDLEKFRMIRSCLEDVENIRERVSYWIGLVRADNAGSNADLARAVVQELCKNSDKEWRINPNIHIQLGLK